MSIAKKVIYKLKFIYFKLLDWSIKKFINPPKMVSIEKTMDKMINDNCSIGRYGDGEFKVIFGLGNGFQNPNQELAKRLKEILVSDNDNFIVAIPDIFDDLSMYKNHAKLFWKEYLIFNRFKIYKLLKKDKKYYNAFVTRLYMDWIDESKTKEWFVRLSDLWNDKDVVIIEGEGSRIGVGNDMFHNTKCISRILAPATDAFNKYEDILSEAQKIDKNKLILIALGQTATVLSYDLCKLGYQAIDIGHIDIEYEWFLMKATKKVKIENKYVNEAADGKVITELNDEKYLSEIICRISGE